MKNLKILQVQDPALAEPIWSDPPPRQSRQGESWLLRLRPLLAHPGRWAELKTFKTVQAVYATTNHLRRGRLDRPPGRWEFASRTMFDGRFVLFGRYLGPEE